jgi:hypothetical protein
MSLQTILQQLNSPILVTGSGAAVFCSLPTLSAVCAKSTNLGLLKAATVAAYAINCVSVSNPGRIDGEAQKEMQGNTKTSDESSQIFKTIYSTRQGRSLIVPAGWAFAIWGPIYLGEAIFSISVLLKSSDTVLSILPAITAPLVAANIFQSLWCASFRPSYMTTKSFWQKYVSVAMLGGTAYSLSLVHTTVTSTAASSWLFIPIFMHFGWTTAATLVNLNGSIAMSNVSDTTVIAVGHTSTLLATVLGVAVTLLQQSPVYGLTVAWALLACADGMKKRQLVRDSKVSSNITRAMKVQQTLCYIGSGLCAATAVASYFRK